MKPLHVVAALLVLPFVLGIGISPATIQFDHDQRNATVTVVVSGESQVSLVIDGPLADNFRFPKTVNVSGREQIFLTHTGGEYTPGRTLSQLTATEVHQGENIAANAGVTATIAVTQPRNGSYITGTYLTTTLRPHQEGTIPFRLTNYGNASTTVSTELTVANITRERTVTVPAMGRRTVGYDATLPAGVYEATVAYANKTKSRIISVGRRKLLIRNITVASFSPLRIQATLHNVWNEPVQTQSSIRAGNETFPAPITTVPPRLNTTVTYQVQLPNGRYNATLRANDQRQDFFLVIRDSYVRIDQRRYERVQWTFIAGIVLAALLILLLLWYVTTKQ